MPGDDLFSQRGEELVQRRAPLAERMRPRTLDEVVGQAHLVGPGRAFRRLVEEDRLSSALLYGPPGSGKTTLAEVVARHTKREFVRLSATNAGVKDVRDTVEAARRRLGEFELGTIVFIDEIHRFSKAQQDVLLPSVESGLITLIGATTENPFHSVNPALRSRSTLFRTEPVSEEALVELLKRALGVLGGSADDAALELLARCALGDARQALGALEVAFALCGEARRVLEAHAEEALGTSALRYGRDDHYDVVSAFIKSIRGSDADAALHYLARMIESGEDPRFIARRLVISASEDIGVALPAALSVAVAAAHAVEFVGLPEAALNLAQATVYLAKAPKSYAVTRALMAAFDDVRSGRVGEVPTHLRDAHYKGASELGHGSGYRNPHEHPDLEQQYLPDLLEGRRYLPES